MVIPADGNPANPINPIIATPTAVGLVGTRRRAGPARMAAKRCPVSGAMTIATSTVNARFINGALTPLEPPDLPDGILVELNIQTLDAPGPGALV